MPIPPKDFHDGLEPPEAELLAALERKPYQAYTVHDLIDLRPRFGDGVIMGVLEVMALRTKLDRLVEKGLAKSKYMRHDTYYLSSKA